MKFKVGDLIKLASPITGADFNYLSGILMEYRQYEDMQLFLIKFFNGDVVWVDSEELDNSYILLSQAD